MTTWTTEDDTNTIAVGETQQGVEGEIAAGDVSELAQSEGVAKFKVEDEDRDEMDRDEFPLTQSDTGREKNANGGRRVDKHVPPLTSTLFRHTSISL